MIEANINKGSIKIHGASDEVLTEFVLINSTVLKTLSEITDNTNIIKKLTDLIIEYTAESELKPSEIYKNVLKVLGDEL